jgi:FMN-dependent NADH-azoreductase
MAKLLHIQTSPRGSRSASQVVAEQRVDLQNFVRDAATTYSMRRVLPKWDVILCPS